ncbi:Acetate operon repressor [Pandoraea pulmonicola]|nr:Acetate operon repressor [Pandoraea pulmonicola]
MPRATDGIQPRTTRIQSIERAAGLLRQIAASNLTGLRLVDLVRMSGLPKATVSRILSELSTFGFVVRDDAHRFHLGAFSRELGVAASAHFRLPDLCRPVVASLADLTGEAVYLKMKSGTEVICLDMATPAKRCDVGGAFKGCRVSLGVGAGGLALLSFLAEEERRGVLNKGRILLPSGSVLYPDTLARRVEQTRATGFAESAGEVVPGMSALGFPIFDTGGRPVVAMSVAVPTSKLTAAHRRFVLERLREHAGRVQTVIRHHRVMAHDPLSY